MTTDEGAYEVCIAGCGIAGSTLALNLASDFDVCVIERKPIGKLGCKPCGNSVHRAWFEFDGVEPKPSDFDAVSSAVDSIDLCLSGIRMRADLPQERTGLVLNKRRYVRRSLEASLDGGSDFIQGRAEPVLANGKVREVRADGKKVKAEVYVDASGVSAVMRKHFLPTPSGAFFRGYRETVDGELEEKSWHVYQDGPGSAFWASPSGKKTNIGGVAFRDGAKLKNGVRRLKNEIGLEVKEVLDSGFGSIPSHRPVPLVHENVVSIGDSGFTANPLTGGGIGPSVKTSNLLAYSLRRNEGLGNFEEKYLEEVAGSYERNYWLSRLLLKLQPLIWKRVAMWAFEKFYGGKLLEAKG